MLLRMLTPETRTLASYPGHRETVNAGEQVGGGGGLGKVVYL